MLCIRGDLPPHGWSLAEHMPALVRPPGKVTAHSNYGCALACSIVQQVFGIPFEQYVEQHIFEPLGIQFSIAARILISMAQAWLLDGRLRGG